MVTFGGESVRFTRTRVSSLADGARTGLGESSDAWLPIAVFVRIAVDVDDRRS
jgi:hypothetical protein